MMSRLSPRPIRATDALLVLGAVLALSACVSAATPSPAPSATPSPTPRPATVEPTPSPTSTITLSPSPTPTPTVTPSPPPELGLTWSRVPDAPGLRVVGGGMRDVVAGGPGFVAVGAGYENDASFAAVWTSVDGVTWERVPHTPEFEGVGMSAVAAGGPGFVAVGGGCCPDRAAVWTSPDGLRWSRVPHSPVFDNATMKMIAAWGEGFLAIGWEAYGEAAGTLLWGSPDGTAWSRLSSEAFSDAIVDDVAAGGPGLVAVGYRCPPGGGISFCARSPAIWISADGFGWTEAPVVDGRAGEITAIATGPAGLLAFGSEPGEAPDRWLVTIRTSSDGRAWTRLATPAVFDRASVASVRWIGPVAFALGGRLRTEEKPLPLIWRSTDGTDWEVVLEGSPSDVGRLWEIAGNGSVLVAVGQTHPEGATMIWISPALP